MSAAACDSSCALSSHDVFGRIHAIFRCRSEWPIPPKPAKQYTHGWKGRDKGHKRDRIAAANQAAWKEACKVWAERGH